MSTSADGPSDMPPPPAKPLSAKAKGKQKAKENNNPDDLTGPKRKRLACEICRIRRVKCEWRDAQGSCQACLNAQYQCPGEPTRKKRLKKGEVEPDEKMLELERKLRAFEIGGAMTFQMIERGFKHAPPDVLGLPTGYYKQYVRTCAGASKEREIAAEVLCAAFVAGAATFTDHAKIVTGISPDMPVATPSRVRYNYSAYVPFGSSRSEAVLALAFQSRQIFEDSTMRHRPSPEAIYCLIVMDWMANLTREAVEGGKAGKEKDIDTEYAEVLCRSYRTLMMGRRSEINPKDLEFLLGPVNAYLFFLDARNAARTGSKPTFLSDSAHRLFNIQSGARLLSRARSAAVAARLFDYSPVSQVYPAFNCTVALLEPIWGKIDLSLSNLALLLSNLPTLPPSEDSMHNRYELEGVIQNQQLNLALLDLLIHQKIVQAFLPSSTSSNNPVPPSPGLLNNYATSRSRVQDVFRLVTSFARGAIETMSWKRAREVVEVLAVCSAWTSLANEEDDGIKVQLIHELGITIEMGQILEQCLALASWSSPSAGKQREGLLVSLVFAYGPLPPNNLPPPPTTLPPAPKPPPVSVVQIHAPALNALGPREEDHQIDLSFLDDFAREHGIPIDDETTGTPSTSGTSTPSSSSATLAPPLASFDWDSIMASDDLEFTQQTREADACSNPDPPPFAFDSTLGNFNAP
ncbi:hypothetical protein JCM5350_003165 [Sporobolomyces pararoseus]